MQRVLDYLRLMRASNVLTAVSNVLMGYLQAAGSWQPVWAIGLLMLASCSLYLAGMVLNDLFDLEVDRSQRPERPLPSGRVSVRSARLLGSGLLLLGVVLAFLVTWLQPETDRGPYLGRTGIVAICLAVCILAYDGGGKNLPVGPLLMGGCRFFNVLLGCSICAVKPTWHGFEMIQLIVAGGVGIYVAGITWFAKYEHEQSRQNHLILSALVMAGGISLLASQLPVLLRIHSTALNGDTVSSDLAIGGLLLLLLILPVASRIFLAINNPSPKNVQRAVVVSLLTLIMIDAAICYFLAMHQPIYGLVVAALLLPTVWLGRWINPT